MAVTENNTALGNVTTFSKLGAGAYFKRQQDGNFYIKLDAATAKKADDDAQNYSIEPDAAVTAVAAERVNITYDP